MWLGSSLIGVCSLHLNPL